MFKKIHSNRDPQGTVYSELKKEFAVYFAAAEGFGRRITERYPNFLFGVMVLMMLTSMVLSFTVFHKAAPPPQIKAAPKASISPLSNGFDQIMATGAALKETITLKRQVDSLTAKKVLSAADSTVLEKDLDRLQQINNHLTK
ncbi:hypothetical protein HDF18_13225 [Mucilaginibacter sp. X5P1]|uniref:hypothetical protein n=1 Tax=Mucilaginibacter sp. X5P1 TaxID=2723088 RepID=UPI00162295E1|nr:hypothetical protein [Mucilaginibacter sp. X5P1]MBB6141697.1 hypothetical protein [Mucilaginibacter sp. X5P1]